MTDVYDLCNNCRHYRYWHLTERCRCPCEGFED